MEIWRGRVLWRGYVHPHTHPPYPTEKVSRGFPIPIPIPSQCGDSPSKRGGVYLSSLLIVKLKEIK